MLKLRSLMPDEVFGKNRYVMVSLGTMAILKIGGMLFALRTHSFRREGPVRMYGLGILMNCEMMRHYIKTCVASLYGILSARSLFGWPDF